MSKKTLILISCLVLSLTIGLGGSLAYLTDTDTKVNTFTMGNVKIEVNESTGTEYDGLMPGVEMTKLAKIINRGANDAYVFMTAAVPEELSKYITLVWNPEVIATGKGVKVLNEDADDGRFDVTDGNGKKYKYEVLAWTSKVTPANMTDDLLVGVKLNEWVNLVDGQYYDMSDGTLNHPITGLDSFKVVVTGHAIQADGIHDWQVAYNNYMGQWNNWTLDYTSSTTPGDGTEPDPDQPTQPENPNAWDGVTVNTEWYDAAQTTFEIGTPAQLAGLAKLVNENDQTFANKTVKLTQDIDLNMKNWKPIGQTGATEFKGVFDGNNQTIYNLKVDSSAEEGGDYSSGLFGWIESHGSEGVTVKNLTVDCANITGHHNVGVIVGYVYGNIHNCTVKNATIINTHANNDACGDKSGIIAGYAGDGHFTNNTAIDCTVTGGRDAGQLFGCIIASQEPNFSNNTAENVMVTATGDCTGANIKNEIYGRKTSN